MPNSIRIRANDNLNSPESLERSKAEPLQIAHPNPPDASRASLHELLSQIARDPFVGYVSETDHSYVVTLRHSQRLDIPKGHEFREKYPPPSQTAGERTIGMLGWMLFGLLPAGVGAFILCPFVLRDAFSIMRASSSPRERRLALVTAIVAIVLGVIGEIFVLLLVLHFIG